MAYTYDITTARGQVRFLIPDNNILTAELQDDEIDYLLDERGDDVTAATIDACMQLSRRYAQLVSFKADGLSMQHSQRAKQYAERADALAGDAAGGIVSAGLNRQDGYAVEAAEGDYGRYA